MKVSDKTSASVIQNRLANQSNKLNQVFNQLSSGSRITKAADDAASLAISTSLEHALAAMDAARTNANEATSFTQVADSGIGQIQDGLGRLRELAVGAANGTLSDAQRQAFQSEAEGIVADVDRITQSTEFNGTRVLEADQEFQFQVGTSEDETIRMETGDGTSSEALGLEDIDLSTASGAQAALTAIDEATEQTNAQRSAIGAVQNRLERASVNLSSSIENTVAANSQIRDLDVAAASAEKVRTEILQQSNVALLVQASQFPQAALNLLG
ncbi:MAG TPA: flagellin FliC [Myxococcales bacterium]|nr:flagellin FliC [Myxococcales bacterium]